MTDGESEIQERLNAFCKDLDCRFRPGQVHTRTWFWNTEQDSYCFGFLVKAAGPLKDRTNSNRNFSFVVCERPVGTSQKAREFAV